MFLSASELNGVVWLGCLVFMVVQCVELRVELGMAWGWPDLWSFGDQCLYDYELRLPMVLLGMHMSLLLDLCVFCMCWIFVR